MKCQVRTVVGSSGGRFKNKKIHCWKCKFIIWVKADFDQASVCQQTLLSEDETDVKD